MQVCWIGLLALVHTTVASVFPVPHHLNISSVEDATVGNATNAIESNRNSATGNATQIIIASRAGSGRRAGSKKKNLRSTSSSSGEKGMGSSKGSDDSLGVKSSDGEESSSREKQSKKLSGEGWRKWHRKCTPCPTDMAMKWREPTVKWICGGYQRARRSFKSECMMFLRNCQDGTSKFMFSSIKWICRRRYLRTRRSFKSKFMMCTCLRNCQEGIVFTKIADYRCNDKAPGYNGGRHFFYDYPVKMPDDSSDGSSKSDSESVEEYSDDYTNPMKTSNSGEIG